VPTVERGLREVDADLRILDLPDSTEYRTKRTQLYEELLCSRSLVSGKAAESA
jgi:hypothetical protein